MPVWPAISTTTTDDADSTQNNFNATSTLLQAVKDTTAATTRVIGVRFFVPSTFETNFTVDSVSMSIWSVTTKTLDLEAVMLIGSSPAWAHTTDVETGRPWQRRSSSLNTGTPVSVTATQVMGQPVVINFSTADLTAALAANGSHSSSGTYIGVLLYPKTTGTQDAFQFYSANHTSNLPPKLNITYSPPSIALKLTKSVSGRGGVGLHGAPQCIGRWHGDNPEILPNEALIPKSTTGAGDLGPTDVIGSANPNGLTWALWAAGAGIPPTTTRIRLSSANAGTLPPVSDRPARNYNIFCEGYANQIGQVEWDSSYWRKRNGTCKTASGALSVRHSGLPSNGDPNPAALIARKSGSEVWRIEYRTFTIDALSHQVRLRNVIDNTATAWSTTRYASLNWHRWEFQVSNAVSGGELKARLYTGSNTTPSETFSLACSNVEFDSLRAGTTGFGFTPIVNVYLNDIEFWDDYYCNGKWRDERRFGELFNFKGWEFFIYNGEEADPKFDELEVIGQITDLEPFTIDPNGFDRLASFVGDRWRRVGPSASDDLCYTKHTVNYSNHSGSARHTADVYVPLGDPPEGGWKVIFYLHGGFFVTGTRALIPEGLVTEAVLRGYVIISLDIILSSLDPIEARVTGTGSQAYPAWNPNLNTARHPTQILDYKMAVEYFQRDAVRATYNLSKSGVAMGHSAGGYPAAAAMLSKDLTDDGNGLSYRLKDHAGYGYPNVNDPEIKGVYVFSPPTDFEKLRNYDVTNPNYLYLNTGQYTVETTMQLYWGLNFTQQPTQGQLDGSRISQMALLTNEENLKPFFYAGGLSDYLVPCNPQFPDADQAQPIYDAYESRGLAERCKILRQKEIQHYQTLYLYDSGSLFKFIKDVM